MKSYLSSLVPPAFRLSIFSIKSFLCDVEAGTSRFFWQLSTSVLYSNHLFWKKKRTKQQLGRWVLFKLYSRLGNPSTQQLSLAQMVRCPCHQKAKITSLRSRRLEKKRAREKGTRASPSPVLSFAHYFQAPATQAKDHQRHGKSTALFAIKWFCPSHSYARGRI